MINLGEWGTIAGSITAIVSLILLVIRPVTASFSKITETLSKVSHNLDLLTKDLESSKSDRLMIHEELKNIPNKARLRIGPEVMNVGQKLGRKMRSSPLIWNSGRWQAEIKRDCKLLVEVLRKKKRKKFSLNRKKVGRDGRN